MKLKKMFFVGITIVAILVLFTTHILSSESIGAVPSKLSPEQSVIQIRGTCFSSQQSTAEVTWALVPGGTESFIRRYFVQLEVINKGDRSIDLPAVEAYFYEEDGDVLLIRNFKYESEIERLKPSDKVIFHLDTDGYTNWLLMGNKSVTLYVLILKKGEILSANKAILPPYIELEKRKSQVLDFLPINKFPNVEKLEPVKIDEWPMDIPAPAISREEGGEMGIYFYYKNPGKIEFIQLPTPMSQPTITPTPTPPGFEAIFSIAGLLAVAYLLRRRK